MNSEPFNPISMDFSIQLVKSPAEATMLGITRHEDYQHTKALRITNVVIVENGTQGGKPTLDIQLVDAEGNTYVAMTTAALIGGVARVAGATQ